MNFPPLVLLSGYRGDWTSYLDEIYRIYMKDIVNGGLSIFGKPLRCKYTPPTGGKGFTFWHVISEGKAEEDRTPDLRRCERIHWIRFLIENREHDQIRWWKNQRGSSERIVIWTHEMEFAVVLEERRDKVLLWTAYTVESAHRKRSFEREWKVFWENKKG